MKILNKSLLRKYVGEKPEIYNQARNLTYILIFVWTLLLILLFLHFIYFRMPDSIVYLFIIVNIALFFVSYGKLGIATPVTLSVLITYSLIYTYILTFLGLSSIVLQFMFRGMRLGKEASVANVDDYIVALFLIFISGFIYARVIGQNKRNLNRLKNSEEKYSMVVNNATDGIVIQRDGIVLFANNAAAEIAGISKDNLIGKRVSDFIASIEYEKGYKSSHDSGMSENKIKQSNGMILNIESKRTKILFEGKEAALLILRDISEKKITGNHYSIGKNAFSRWFGCRNGP